MEGVYLLLLNYVISHFTKLQKYFLNNKNIKISPINSKNIFGQRKRKEKEILYL